ncbi:MULTISPECIES: SHOCT domain-containing protein [unclassified Streptomyces]|uniref:SHOCT domain-containing protein n=1 Tax=unclassified Streptomyces TaxID=2593676 RepID=UPI002257ACFB|nr:MULTISPECIES: SHOCT domain-containing protein [unclassified Streptomyces]MCX4625504.1 SHOCT domain-containing protein [Streptomyces sp. NBC_01443]WSW49090.1 SHOCT domain-containing protein [Streptomyces sp. NBC_01001]
MTTQVYLAYDFPLLSVFWTMLGLALWILWFFLLFRIIFDIFRDDDLGGWAKAGWLAFVILLPFLGVFVYLIARGKSMGHRELTQARTQQKEFDTYIRETAGAARPSSTEELAKLSDMRARGDITDEEFRRAKALVLTDYGPEDRATPMARPSGDDEQR